MKSKDIVKVRCEPKNKKRTVEVKIRMRRDEWVWAMVGAVLDESCDSFKTLDLAAYLRKICVESGKRRFRLNTRDYESREETRSQLKTYKLEEYPIYWNEAGDPYMSIADLVYEKGKGRRLKLIKD